MLGISVCITVLAHVPLLELISEAGGRLSRFGISLNAHSLPDIRLGNIGIDCAGVSDGSGRSDAHAGKERVSARVAGSRRNRVE